MQLLKRKISSMRLSVQVLKANFLKNFSKYIDRASFYQGSKEELVKFLSDYEEIMYKPVNGLAGKDVKKMIIEIFERIYVENNTDLFIENEDNGITEYVGNKIEINVYTIDY